MHPLTHLANLTEDSTFDELVEAVTKDRDRAKNRLDELRDSNLFHKNDTYLLGWTRRWADLQILHRHLVLHKYTYGV